MAEIKWRSGWDDPMVQEALKERRPSEIALLCCPKCGVYSYWNQGSHFTCSVEGCEYSASGDVLDELVDEVVTLDNLADMEIGDVP